MRCAPSLFVHEVGSSSQRRRRLLFNSAYVPTLQADSFVQFEGGETFKACSAFQHKDNGVDEVGGR